MPFWWIGRCQAMPLLSCMSGKIDHKYIESYWIYWILLSRNWHFGEIQGPHEIVGSGNLSSTKQHWATHLLSSVVPTRSQPQSWLNCKFPPQFPAEKGMTPFPQLFYRHNLKSFCQSMSGTCLREFDNTKGSSCSRTSKPCVAWAVFDWRYHFLDIAKCYFTLQTLMY